MATATELDLEEEVETPVIEPEGYYEIVDGRVVEDSPLAARDVLVMAALDQLMGYHARVNRLGRVAPEMLFTIDRSTNLRRKPDVAFVSRERWPLNRPWPTDTAWDVIPDLVIEIVSPTDRIDDLMDKIEEYFRAGVRLGWVVYPRHLKVYTYDSPTSVRILQVGDDLDGGAVFPGFRLPLASLFAEVEEAEPPANP
jgi:Uma2 family endonuclease